MTRPTLINLNPVELNYYPSIISLDKYNGRYYGVDLSTKIFVPSVIKKNVKVFNVIRRINEVKTLLNIFHVAVNANLIVQDVTEAKNGIIIIINANVIVKSVMRAKKIKTGIAAHVYLRIIGISKVDDDR